MKKISLLAALLVLFAVPSMAANAPGTGIKNSKHNLGSTGFGSSYGGMTVTAQICVFCHTPHNSDGNSTRPLWVRSTLSVSKLYSSITINNKPQTSLMSVAKLCLSCHDNAVAIAAGASNLGTSTNSTLTSGATIRALYDIGAGGAQPGDLSNDHPVGMNYETSRSADDLAGGNAALRASGSAGGPPTSWFKNLGGGNSTVMDCSTCHELHNSTSNAKFLRVTRDSSGICRTCHNK